MRTHRQQSLGVLTIATAWLVGALDFVSGQSNNANVPSGIVVYKERSAQSDEFAGAAYFQRMERYAVSSNFYMRAGEPLRIENINIAGLVNLETIKSCDLLDESTRASLQSKLTELSALAKRFPRCADLIKPITKEISQDLERFAGGQTRFRGAWMTSAEYVTLVRKEREEAVALERKLSDSLKDKAQREKNLKSRPASLTGRKLLTEYSHLVSDLERNPTSRAAQDAARLPLAASIMTGALPLRKFRDDDIGLRDGGTLDSCSILFVRDKLGCKAALYCVGLRMESGAVVNTDELIAARAIMKAMLPELAEWLPLGLISARTRLELQKGKEGARGLARITREFAGHSCELMLSEPVTHDDGSLHAMLSVNLR